MEISQNRPFIVAERIAPFALGLGMAAGYYHLSANHLRGSALLAHTVGLSAGAFTSLHQFQEKKIDSALLFSPLLLNGMMLLFLKESRLGASYFLPLMLVQICVMRFVAHLIIFGKKRAIESAFNEETMDELFWPNLSQRINGLAYQKDADEVKAWIAQESNDKLCGTAVTLSDLLLSGLLGAFDSDAAKLDSLINAYKSRNIKDDLLLVFKKCKTLELSPDQEKELVARFFRLQYIHGQEEVIYNSIVEFAYGSISLSDVKTIKRLTTSKEGLKCILAILHRIQEQRDQLVVLEAVDLKSFTLQESDDFLRGLPEGIKGSEWVKAQVFAFCEREHKTLDAFKIVDQMIECLPQDSQELGRQKNDLMKVRCCISKRGNCAQMEAIANTITTAEGKKAFCAQLGIFSEHLNFVLKIGGGCDLALQEIAKVQLDLAESLIKYCDHEGRYQICKAMINHPLHHDAIERLAIGLEKGKQKEIFQKLAVNNVAKGEKYIEFCDERGKANVCFAMSRYPQYRKKALEIGKTLTDSQMKLEVFIVLAKNAPEMHEELQQAFQIVENQYNEEDCKAFYFVCKGKQLDADVVSPFIIPPKMWNRSSNIFWEQVSTLKEGAKSGTSVIKGVFIGDCKHQILKTKEVIGKGGEKDVFLAYDLTAGTFYVKKEVREREVQIMDIFKMTSKMGLPGYVNAKKKRNSKYRIYQPLYDGDLIAATKRGYLKTRETKLFVIEGILKALVHFHGHEFDLGVGTSCPAMHGDIKPKNIVIEKETLSVMLIDLGSVAQTEQLFTSPLYLDPHTLKQGTLDRQKELTLRVDYGQKRDVWATGLVISGILFAFTGDGETDLPYTQVLSKNYTPKQNRFHAYRKNLESISNDAIQNHFDEIGSAKEPLIGLLKGMLQMDPNQRLTAEKCLQEFRKVVPEVEGPVPVSSCEEL